MSLTVDLRLPGGAKSATVTGVGQKINLEVWATVKGANSSTSDDGFQMAAGSLLSTNVNGGAANGTMTTALVPQFTHLAAQLGKQQDLDGDGDLDVGSNDNVMVTNHYVVRSGTMQVGTSFKIGTAVFTVTSLKSTTGQTNLNYRFMDSNDYHHTWREDGVNQNPRNGDVFVNGSPVVLKRSGGTTPPGTASVSGIVWGDTDKDKIVDSGEPRLSGKRMYIDSNLNGKLDTGEKNVLTNSSGVYNLTGLAAGTYRVRRADLPAGYTFSTPTGGYHTVTLTSGQVASGRNFGAIPITSTTTGGKISGTVFGDLDKDGVLDTSDTRLANKRMYIDANKNGKYDTGEKNVLTNSSGVYTFTGLSAGTYRVRRADLPAGYKYSTPSIGYYDIVLGTNQSVINKNFGAVPI